MTVLTGSYEPLLLISEATPPSCPWTAPLPVPHPDDEEEEVAGSKGDEESRKVGHKRKAGHHDAGAQEDGRGTDEEGVPEAGPDGIQQEAPHDSAHRPWGGPEGAGKGHCRRGMARCRCSISDSHDAPKALE